ncbi:hypothetical protein [Stenotrophomonas sp.]|uniref:hypothetical protein n=1 Tax=Stenotrophomonas sp. TaxID=69392 RepID=UPI00334169DC
MSPSEMPRAPSAALNTSDGARCYIAHFFAREMRRHDFATYIATDLAADFACALAQHLAATGKQQAGEPEIEFQARLMDVKTDLPTENWRHSPTYDENPGRGTHYWVQFRKRYIYYNPPAQGIDPGNDQSATQEPNTSNNRLTQGIDLGQLERIRNELHAMSGQVPDEWIDPIVELQQDVQKLIDSQRDTSPGVGNG